jgi:transposase
MGALLFSRKVKMGPNFKPCDRDQQLLLPPSLHDWLPEGHLARFIVEATAQMDLKNFKRAYNDEGAGQAAFHPAPMVALLLYSYCLGVRSSRQLEQRCEEDVASRYIMANQRPDHSTLCRFRERHESALSAVFTQILRLCRKAGALKVGLVALDGTKLCASAALDANRKQDALAKEVPQMLQEARSTDAREDQVHGKDQRGDELPKELQTANGRLARLKACQAQLQKADDDARKAQEKKLAERAKTEAERGQPLRGRKPKSPAAVGNPDAKANVTDPESRIMKTRKGYVQGYNGQIVVTAQQYMLAAEVTQEENDQQQARPLLKQARANLKAVGVKATLNVLLLDAGYCNEKTLKLETDHLELFCATTKDWKQRKALQEQRAPRGRIPKMLSVKDRMERKLRTKRGQRMYRKRGQLVEPVFGQVQTVQDGKRCMRRGVNAVRSEWRFTCGAHNLLKLWRSERAEWR